MSPDLAKRLLPLMANFDALSAYADARIAHHKDQFIESKTLEEVRGHQGAIKELQLLKSIKDQIGNVLKRDF